MFSPKTSAPSLSYPRLTVPGGGAPGGGGGWKPLFDEPLLLDAFRVRLCTWRLPDRLLPRRRSCALRCAVLRSCARLW